MKTKIIDLLDEKEQQYILSLNEKEKKGYEIAKSHLGTAFRLNQSVGFVQWLKKKDAEPEKQKL
jgi:hypothetical protein